ncbi:MAG: hypothetical protein JW717_13215, partial [Marinilabiliaceae bacterium]|nr:hypothetical protein [Marinilabiliaceae bacterium]
MIDIQNLLKELEDLQSRDSKYFPEGLFPSYRENYFLNFSRLDDNIYFSASIAFILKQHLESMTIIEAEISKKIIESVVACYEKYKNPNRISYNFWAKRNNSWFPNGLFLNRFKHFALPDDIDTTSMILLTKETKVAEVDEYHNTLPHYANGTRYSIRNGLRRFQKLSTYSTWFGERMPIETDVCVLSNTLFLFATYGVEFNRYDCDVVFLMEQIIDDQLYISHPFEVAPEYPKTEIIIYHLARLAGAFPELFKDRILNKFKADVLLCYNKSDGFNCFLLELSLMHLNEVISDSSKSLFFDLDRNKNWWFTAGFLS